MGDLVREATLDQYVENPEFVDHLGVHHPPLQSLWKEWDYQGYKWGMAIDLTPASAATPAWSPARPRTTSRWSARTRCERGREMHWIRIDRYFKGDPDATRRWCTSRWPARTARTAPCENVCPVDATVHSHEGLNVMVYNRCIGTRYCSNNCPYKVRRFNFFDYNNEPGPG